MGEEAWADIADVATKVVADAAGSALASCGIPGAADVIQPLLRAFLQIQDQQAEAITRVDANVQRLIDGPWQTARDYIEEASLPDVTPEQREEKLRNASEQLHSAVPLQPEGSIQRAYASIDLALVERLLGDTGSSELQAHRAAEAASAYIVAALEEIKKSKDTRRHDLEASLATWLALAGAARAAVKLHTLDSGFPAAWREYGEIQKAASALCGGDDAELREYAERVSAKVGELKLTKLVNKLTAANT